MHQLKRLRGAHRHVPFSRSENHDPSGIVTSVEPVPDVPTVPALVGGPALERFEQSAGSAGRREGGNLMYSSLLEEYFKSTKISTAKSEAVFYKTGRKRFGAAFDEVISIIAERSAGAEKNPYNKKNQSLDLSLYVGSYYVSAIWREFAAWLVKENLPPPSGVLDLGCENGVLTCLYATLWPSAKVIGLDASGPAIAAARELAFRLRLGNVTFEHGDARQFLHDNPNVLISLSLPYSCTNSWTTENRGRLS
jgi:protein-L-isoaspartate O-methyltransferase